MTSSEKKTEKTETKKTKKGFFSNFRKKIKSGGKKGEPEATSVAVRTDVVKSEGIIKVREKDSSGDGVSATGEGEVGSEEEREEKKKQELYNAIGYSEDEEYIEFPKEVIWHCA